LAQLSNHPQALILIDARPLIVIDALQATMIPSRG